MLHNGWTMPKIINQDRELRFHSKYKILICLLNNDAKLEIFLDEFVYRSDEIMVSSTGGDICVKGRQVEKSDSG
jgi:hypothetical protein